MSAISDRVRTLFKEGDDVRDAGLKTPEDIIRHDDLLYGSDPKWQRLDLYRPKKEEGKDLPVIVSVHGGGWVYGDKERYQYYCMSLAQRGFAVVNFTYRLAPEFQWPSPLEDTNLVMAWIMAHAQEYHLDTNHLFAVGDSAGGHMLSLYIDFLTNPEYAAQFAFRAPAGMSLQAAALNCGVYDMPEHLDDKDMTALLMKDFLKDGGTPQELAMISPIKHMTAQFIPCFVMSASDDFLSKEVPGMVSALIANHVPFEVHFYGTAEKKLPHVFHCNMKSEDARICNDEECAFFRRFC